MQCGLFIGRPENIGGGSEEYEGDVSSHFDIHFLLPRQNLGKKQSN